MSHVPVILSGLAYLALCLLVAGTRCGALPVSATVTQPGRKSHETFLSDLPCLLVLPAFLCIPLGALPAFMPVSWSGAAAVVCLTVSSALDPEGKPRRHFRLHAPIRLGLALAACAWHARQRGVPGDLLSLDTYVGMPLAGVVEGLDGTGLILLALGSLPAPASPARTGTAALAQELRQLAGLGLWLGLFLPANLTRALNLPVLAGLALDAVYFWIKLLLLDYALRLAAPLTPTRLPAMQAVLVCAGALLLLFG